MPDETMRTVLEYVVNQQKLGETRRLIGNLKKENDALVKQVGRLGVDGGPALDNVLKRIDRNRLALKDATTQAEALRRKLKEVGDTKVPPTLALPQAPTGFNAPSAQNAVDPRQFRQTNAITRFGQELRALPSIQIPGTSTGTDALANVLRLTGPAITAMTGSLQALVTVALPVTAAIAAIGATLAIFSRQNEDGAKGVRSIIKAQRDYLDLIATGTSTELQDAIDNLRQVNDARQALIQQRRGQFADLESQVTTAGRAFADILNIAGAKEAREDLQRLEDEYGDASAAIRVLEAALDGSHAAANDAALAFEQLNGTLGDLFQRQIDRQVTVAQEQYSLTEANAAAQLKAFEDERNRLNAEAQILEANQPLFEANVAAQNDLAEASGRYLQRQEEVRQRLFDLNYILIPIAEGWRDMGNALTAATEARKRHVDELERAAQRQIQVDTLLANGTAEQVDARLQAIAIEQRALREQADALRAAAPTSEEAAKALDSVVRKMGDLSRESIELQAARPDIALRQINDLFTQLQVEVKAIQDARDSRIGQIEADLREKEGEIAQKAADDRLEADAKAQEAREEQEKEHQDRMRQIVRRANAAMANAIGERDALAFFLARQQRDDELDEEEKANKKRLASIDKAKRDELRTIEKRNDEQLKAARTAAEKAIRLERQKADAEIILKQNAYNAQTEQLRSSLMNQFALSQQGWNAITSYAQRAVNFIQALTGQAQTQIKYNPTVTTVPGSGTKTTAPYQYTIPSTYQFRAGGGDAKGWTMVGEKGRELVYFPDKVRVVNNKTTERMLANAMNGGMPKTMTARIALDGPATTRLLEGKVVDVLVAIEGVS